jgi:hypothetical protein
MLTSTQLLDRTLAERAAAAWNLYLWSINLLIAGSLSAIGFGCIGTENEPGELSGAFSVHVVIVC